MKLRVQYLAQLRAVIGRAEEDVELPEGSNLATLLTHLATRHGRATVPHLLSATGRVQPGLLVVVNGAARTSREADTTVLNSDDIVMLMPPIAGG